MRAQRGHEKALALSQRQADALAAQLEEARSEAAAARSDAAAAESLRSRAAVLEKAWGAAKEVR